MNTNAAHTPTSAYIDPPNVDGSPILGTIDDWRALRAAHRRHPRLVLTPANVIAYMREEEG